MNAIIKNNSTQKNCRCEISSEKRLELRQLTPIQLNDLVNTLENELGATQDSNTDSSNASLHCGVAAYLDFILQRGNLTEFLMPYWDYRAELKMANRENSSVHQMIAQIKTSNYSLTIQNLVEDVLAQTTKAHLRKSNFTIDETYQLLAGENSNSRLNEQEQALSEINQIKAFLNSSIHDSGLLQLLLLVTMDLGIGDTSEEARSGKPVKISTTLEPNYSSTAEYEAFKSAASTVPTKSFMHHPMTGSLKPIEAMFIVGSSQQSPTAPTHHKKHRKHSRKLKKHKMATATIEVPPTQSRLAASEPTITETSIPENSTGKENRSYRKKADRDKKKERKSKNLIVTPYAPPKAMLEF
uniref:Gag protein n=1 Tax=Ditylenchus dipsaci TaxID=166011 RepID=A0A915DTF6_9BILA